ncbi:(MSHA) biogenesis protein MshI [mine drainage metagenome]|uniref:(MSHA) biogenesis protein MshI n=1 Tax=mine drainage metagenome TaxID=410659 RepID=T1BCA1_9ZZZZ
MWKLGKQSGTKSALTGIVPFGETLALARISRDPGRKPCLEHYAEAAADPQPTKHLEHLIREGAGNRDRLSLVTPWDAYRILLVDAPDVPAHELRSALRWKVKDLIDFHVDDAVIDVFELPAETRSGEARASLYCIAARAEVIRDLTECMNETAAKIAVIDIPEMCVRNLAALAPEDREGLVSVHLESQRGLVVVTRQHTLYLARRLEFGSLTLAADPATVEQLALEIQRSIDYCDRHFHLAIPRTILLLPSEQAGTPLARELARHTGLEVRILDLNDCLESSRKLEQAEQIRGLLAVGAALRLERSA